MIHRWESGRIALFATARYAVALLLPGWEKRLFGWAGGSSSGRAYTRREQVATRRGTWY